MAANQAKKKGPSVAKTPEERKAAALAKNTKIFTKKNYIDATAALMYSLSCSLIHLALLGTIFFVRTADVAKAKKLDSLYMENVKTLCLQNFKDIGKEDEV